MQTPSAEREQRKAQRQRRRVLVMQSTLPDRLVRDTEREAITGIPQSTWYEHIGAGLAPPPVKLGKFAAAYPMSELLALNAARIAGKPDDEIRALVKRLVAARDHAFDQFEAA